MTSSPVVRCRPDYAHDSGTWCIAFDMRGSLLACGTVNEGVLLYDADRINEAVNVSDAELVQAQRNIIQDPFDPKVIAAAKANGVPDAIDLSTGSSASGPTIRS